MQTLGPVLRPTVRTLASALPDLPALADWVAPLPGPFVELFALECPLTGVDRRASLHVDVPADRGDDLRRYDGRWLGAHGPASLRVVADVIAAGVGGGERGFVCEPGVSGYHVAATYASVPAGGEPDRAVDDLARALGVPAPTREAIGELTRQASITHIGAMVGRPSTPTRVVLRADPDSPVWQKVPAAAAARDLAASRPGDETHYLNLDLLDGRFGPRAGLELKPADDPGSLRRRSEPLLHWLSGQGVAAPAVDALGRWEGRTPLAPLGEPATAADVAALAAGAERPGLLRRVNHAKATFTPDGLESVKAYLFVYRLTLRGSAGAGDDLVDGGDDVRLGPALRGPGHDEDRSPSQIP